MSKQTKNHIGISRYVGSIIVIVFIFTLISGCNYRIVAIETPTAANVNLPNIQATETSIAATITSLSIASVEIPINNTPAPVESATPTLIPEQSIAPSAPTFDEWVKSARILLFEDMVGRPKVRRYVKETLERMGLNFEDLGSAKGRLKERLILGGTGGQPWDLIILAIENRDAGSVTGEFFNYLRTNLDKGSSVILEAWHLDRIKYGEISPILDRCGIDIENYSRISGSSMEMVLWPLTTHSILTQPNNYPELRNPTGYWSPTDLGDLMYINGKGDAQLLVGININKPLEHGVVAVCLEGQLILQTFSSHNYFIEPMFEAWENYIYNALMVRYQSLY